MSKTYLSEMLGSFVFFIIILATGDPLMIAVGLLIGILVAQLASQAHLNPAVTAMMWSQGKVSNTEAVWYVGAQLLGAVLAVQWWNNMGKVNVLKK